MIFDAVLSQIPLWNKIIRAVGEAGGYHAFIGGGAIRDRLLGKPVNDIDVFYGNAINLEAVKHFLKLYDFQIDPLDENYDSRLVHLAHGTFVTNVGKDEETHVLNLIQACDIATHTDEFALNISRVFYSNSRGLVLTPEFLDGASSKELVFEMGASDQYRQKIIRKYPEWKVLDGYHVRKNTKVLLLEDEAF